MTDPDLDVVIVGAGPAGLSAALVLARCRRSVMVIDAGAGRNHHATSLHNFLTRDGIAPADLRALGRDELARHDVHFREGTAIDAHSTPPGFSVTYRPVPSVEPHAEISLTCRKLLLATGVTDVLPPIEGLLPLYGRSIHHCPYCDGWGHRDRRLAAYGSGDKGLGLALVLRNWSRDVVACTDGELPSGDLRERAARAGVVVCVERLARVEGVDGRLERILFAGGGAIERDAMFFNTGQVQRSTLPSLLGCATTDEGGVVTGDRQQTGVPGLYVAGDADRDVQFAIVAAGEGATAGVAINKALQEDGIYAA
ncbi:MAG: NAD(P)/FAD-dependent oxidoreductase [Planctomycetota bacterium]|nr:NAD(P)/FAD-dependent oxidoreductase [Planctomycetota bacterium]